MILPRNEGIELQAVGEGAGGRQRQGQRLALLHRRAKNTRDAVLKLNLGKVQPVLIESVETNEGQTTGWGYTPNFLRVAVENSPGPLRVNQLQAVLLTNAHPDGHLIGRTTDLDRQ